LLIGKLLQQKNESLIWSAVKKVEIFVQIWIKQKEQSNKTLISEINVKGTILINLQNFQIVQTVSKTF